jgi:hypothetical protein
MVIDLNFIAEKINASPNCKIEEARKMNKKLIRNVDGINIQEYLAQINNYENEGQFEARKKHAISNKYIVEELLRPTDNAFNARGGSINYKFNVTKTEDFEKDFSEKLSKIKNSHSLRWYIENEWFHKFITDPNGLIVIESDKDNVPNDKRNAYPTYKSINSILDYEQNGIFVDWVIFEPHENELIVEKEFGGKEFGGKENKHEIKKYWALDGENWYLVIKKGDDIIIENTLPHKFDRVPAILCSNIIDNTTGWKKSPIDAQVELLDQTLISNSVLRIVEFMHLYPQQYMYVDDCPRCGGTGITTDKEGSPVTCSKCGGSGKYERKDVTDLIKLRFPNQLDGDVNIDTPSGYIYMPTEAWKQMTESVDRIGNKIFFSHWGTEMVKKSVEGNDYASATGRYIDAQPVNNRLNKYSKSIEQAHTAIADFLGKYYYPNTFNKAFIQYGRRYLIETPDQIWEKYVNARKMDAPVSSLDILLLQYLESEYRENETMYMVELKKVKLEPFIHWSIQTVRSSETISDTDKIKKEFFSEWIQTKTIDEIYSTDTEDLRKQLDKYAQSKLKMIKDGTKKVQ